MNSDLRLCSHNRTVSFRPVTVQDAIDLAQINPQLDEKATTWWLNHLQVEGLQHYDSKEWSQEDRIVGLLYLFFLNQDDVIRNVSYQCSHCEERHTFNADYSELVKKDMEVKEQWPSVELKINKKTYKLQPLTGKDLEDLEQLRFIEKLNEQQIRLQTVARRLGMKAEELSAMSLKDYTKLIVAADENLDKLFHGIDLVTEHDCPNGGGKSRISLPFQADDFLPRI